MDVNEVIGLIEGTRITTHYVSVHAMQLTVNHIRLCPTLSFIYYIYATVYRISEIHVV